LLIPCPTPKLEDNPLLSVRDCLFNIFAAKLHIWRPFLHPQPYDTPCCGEKYCQVAVAIKKKHINNSGPLKSRNEDVQYRMKCP
jgi:hypothetical protein